MKKETSCRCTFGDDRHRSRRGLSMYINVGSNAYEIPFGVTANDGNTTTGTFTQPASPNCCHLGLRPERWFRSGAFYDTNLASDFANLDPP